MIIPEKVKQAMLGYKNEILSREQIIKIVKVNYPGINEVSILPNDYCENIDNKDPNSGKHSIFHYINHNKYQVL